MILRPYYLDQIRPFIGLNVIKVVTGIRRSGKSTILHMVRRELTSQGVDERNITALDLERYSNRKFKNPDVLYEHLCECIEASAQANEKHYLFLDEVQEVERWEQLVTGLQAEFDIDIFLTGSNAHFLSSEFATYLSGRYVEFKVLPFSFAEFREARKASGLEQDIMSDFAVYRKLGGFPFLMELGWGEQPSIRYLADLYNTVVLKDMMEREEIASARLLDALLPFLIANVGHTFSARSIERILKGEGVRISVGTIMSYIAIACRAHLLFKVPRSDAAAKQVFRGQEKYYIADVGLREAMYGSNERNIDQVLENIVYLELIRHGWNVSVGRKDSLPLKGESEESPKPKSRKQTEIDFVATKEGRSIYIQVCYLLADDATVMREFAPLESLRIDWPKYVLSLDTVNRSRNGIAHISIPEFLLEADNLL